MAQAPTATNILQCLRKERSICTFSELHNPPSIRPKSHCPTCLISVKGDRSNSTSSSSSKRRSSISSSDMWQPKQPAKETVANLALFLTVAFILPVLFCHTTVDVNVYRLLVEGTLAYGHDEAALLGQDDTYGTHVSRLVYGTEISIS